MAFKHICAVIAVAAALSPAALADNFKIKVDQTVALKLAKPAESVVLGNATIADVSVHDPMTLLVTGKAFGVTNLLVLDKAGREIYANRIAVAGTDDQQVTVVGPAGTSTFSCIEKCRPTPVVGDSPSHFQETMGTVTSMAGSARGTGR